MSVRIACDGQTWMPAFAGTTVKGVYAASFSRG